MSLIYHTSVDGVSELICENSAFFSPISGIASGIKHNLKTIFQSYLKIYF